MTNHARVLACIANDPSARMRDIAHEVGITERTAAQIVSELERAGYLTRTRVGRRNRYELNHDVPLRLHHQHRTVADLLRFLGPATPGDTVSP